MSGTNLILAYPESGHQIRTFHNGSEVMFCLSDIVRFLADQNSDLSNKTKNTGLAGLTKAIIEYLDPDECYSLAEAKSLTDAQYVTQPGLFRIILRDNSAACKRFQRWVFHEVLPSIQKHGTYPPPTSNETSDVRKAVLLLLEEIDERERLERETKRKFEETDRRLDELSEKISSPDLPPSSDSYKTIDNFCEDNDIPKTHIRKIFGWCIKICAEEGHKSLKGNDEEKWESKFPIHVISKAWSIIKKRQ